MQNGRWPSPRWIYVRYSLSFSPFVFAHTLIATHSFYIDPQPMATCPLCLSFMARDQSDAFGLAAQATLPSTQRQFSFYVRGYGLTGRDGISIRARTRVIVSDELGTRLL